MKINRHDRSTPRSPAPGLLLGLVLLAGLAAVGCTIDQTAEGRLPDVDVDARAGELPEYDVVKREEGRLPDVDVDVDGGRLPKFDVRWADIDVGVTQKKVTVPKVVVVMEEETVPVPFIDFRMPNEQMTERTVSVDLQVPHSGHQVKIEEAWLVGDELWVISRFERTGSSADRALTRVSDRIVLRAPADLDVEHYIVGRRPMAMDDDNYRFIPSRSAISNELKDARRLFRANGNS